ncbi:hypothetical protein T8A63_19185 (plasmid) [Sulfitobacter sp. OXR-159]|uniref:hypothetical protein n=1 Tax=Sulfitobacter sp. OXR-159 TaxID=3100174 RepID=UPI002AC8F4DA|nr:hypothetical protein [Sulfitobacter sp. OXR-159]WPZ31633.1 hypothetical protein T8A63_19185 [Sulfitobacter sp. OXR-159]
MRVYLASLQQCIDAKIWPAAVCLALTLPEMAGAVESPELEARQSYAKWFDQWIGKKYRTSLLSGTRRFLSGSECYALKCAVLYQDVDARAALPDDRGYILNRYNFTSKPEDHCIHKGGVLQLAMGSFCQDVLAGCEAWLSTAENNPRKVARLKTRLGIIG